LINQKEFNCILLSLPRIFHLYGEWLQNLSLSQCELRLCNFIGIPIDNLSDDTYRDTAMTKQVFEIHVNSRKKGVYIRFYIHF
jgi:hypothetical protein